MTTIQTSLNPSDYEFLLKSAVEGNLLTKADSLKRLNSLVLNDKKQFAIYAKRVVLIIQDLLLEPKEDINLLASTLALEIINLNPREIQYYIRTKLLKNVVRNLGDSKPQIRKTSHYCLLAYVKTYKTFDEMIQVYLTYGISSQSWQLRQKSINSFQSILIMEIKYLNWSSAEFRKVVQELLAKTKDESQFVQKAADQCLISICKFEEVRNFSRKLPTNIYNDLKAFCEEMFNQGILQQIKLYTFQTPLPLAKSNSAMHMPSHPTALPEAERNVQKSKVQPIQTPVVSHRQTLLSRIEEIRKKTQTPLKQKQILQQKQDQSIIRKAQSVHLVPKKNPVDLVLPALRKSMNIQEKQKIESETKLAKPDKADGLMMGKKIMEDLKNEKDWKVRLQAIEQLQSKFNASKESGETENIAKNFLPILIKLLGDSNFKVALISLKLIEDILLLENTNYNQIIPQVVQKISDGKIALRQNVSKLIKTEFNRTGNKMWLMQLLGQLKKSPANSNIKQEILNIFTKIIMDSENDQNRSNMKVIEEAVEAIVQGICPLMDDLKTKIKIKTLDLLILISVKTCKIEETKSILAMKLNQIYFEMYLQKVNKEIKNLNINPNSERISTTTNLRNKNQKALLNHRHNKSPGNSTSSSLRRVYSSIDEHNNTVRTASFIDKKRSTYETPARKEDEQETNSLGPSRELDQEYRSEKKSSILKSHRKKTFDYKSTQYSAFSNCAPALEPFNDPDKELKNILIEIKEEDWQTCSQALNKLRRIVQNHSQLLTQPIIKILIPQVMKLVESLRSNLSKTAVITLNDISNKMKKVLDPELDSIFTKLLKKTLDTNSFISQQVRRALISVCANGSQSKVMSLMTNSRSSRAIPIKISIISILEAIAFLPKFYDKQLQKMVTILIQFLDEGSLQIRQRSKTLLSNIINSQKGESLIRLIPSQHIGKIKIKQKEKSIQAKQVSNQEIDYEMKIQDSKLKRKKREKITVFPSEFDQLQSLLEQCQSGDWKNREKNMTTINETIIIPYPKQFTEHKLSGRVMDILSKQIGDPNTKVATNALRILHELPARTPQVIQHNLSVLINEIFNCFGSNKLQIKTLSEALFNQICENIEKWLLIQHLSNGALYGLQKSRSAILSKLNQILPSVYAKGNKKILIAKSVYPLINKLAQQNKPQNMQGLAALMQTCKQYTNGEFVSALKPKAIQIYNSQLGQ